MIGNDPAEAGVVQVIVAEPSPPVPVTLRGADGGNTGGGGADAFIAPATLPALAAPIWVVVIEGVSAGLAVPTAGEFHAGMAVGRVGNSGVSLEPHLHVVLFWYDDSSQPARYWSVPGEWANLYSAPSPQGPAVHHDFFVPRSRTWISAEPF